MMARRKHLYPLNWKQLSLDCKAAAGWRCERCKVRHGARRRSKRTGLWYRVWLHAAHVALHDTLNPYPRLMCLCPTCHGRYDFWLRFRETMIVLEVYKHRLMLTRRELVPC